MPTNFVEVAQKLLSEANSIWSEMGLDEAQRLVRVDRFASAIKISLERLLDEERVARDKMRVAVRESLEKIAEVAGTLGDVDQAMPEGVAAMPLVEQERVLQNRLQSLLAERDARLKDLTRYRTESFALSNELAEEHTGPVAVVEGELLTKDAVKRAESARDELRHERARREQAIGAAAAEAMRICEELEEDTGRVPQRPLPPTRAMADRVTKTLSELRRMRTERADAMSATRRAISVLRDQIGDEAGPELCGCEGVGAAAKKKLERELERLQIVRRERAAKLVASRREKVEAFWEELNLPEAQRQLPGEIEDVGAEGLLELYDAELERLEVLAAEVRPIVQAIVNRERIMREKEAFELETNDQTRLFQRDPGRLLREERQRKVFEKELPRLERSLKERLRGWEEMHGQPFVYRDEPYLLKIEQDEANEKLHKEAERLRKERAKEERKQGTATAARTPGGLSKQGTGTLRGKTPTLKRPLSPISFNTSVNASLCSLDGGELPRKMPKMQ